MAKKTILEELGEMLAHVVEHMATKEDLEKLATKQEIAEFRNEFAEYRNETAENFRDLKAEVADIRQVVEELKSRRKNTEGYSKEIDHALARIARIEKRLGIEPQMAA